MFFFLDYDTEVIERTCIPSNYTCADSSECEIEKKCDTDECNNANVISVNTVTLVWLMLSWMTMFILTGSY